MLPKLLVKSETEQAVPKLIEALEDEDIQVPRIVAKALGEIGDKLPYKALGKIMDSHRNCRSPW